MKPTLEEYLRTIVITLTLLGVGISLQRVKQAKPVFRVVDILVIWIFLPAVVFGSIAWQSPTKILGAAVPLAFIGLGVCFLLSMALAKTMRFDKKVGAAVILNSSFMNVTYLGFPIVYALIGFQYMGAASLYAMAIGIMHLTFGMTLAASTTGEKVSVRKTVLRVLTFPAAFVLIVALLFAFLRAPPPSDIQPAFDYMAKPAFFLMLLLVGYQMPLANPRKYTGALVTTSLVRFVVCPLVTYVTILALGLSLGEITPKPALIMAAMPPAVFNIIIASKYKLDLKLYGALVFYSTIISLFVALPLLMYVFGF